MIYTLIISFFILLFLGFPIAIAMGLSSIIGLLAHPSFPFVIVLQRMFVSIDSFPLMAVPLYMFAGFLMSYGGISRRIINFANSLVGHITGGLGHVNILASMIFAGISGSAVADTAGIGNILIPEMLKKKYSREYCSAVTAISSTIGIVIPPSIPMVIIGAMLSVSVGKLFLGGFIPGIIIGISLMLVAYYLAKKENLDNAEHKLSIKEVLINFKEAIWAILMPIIVVGGIVLGVFTPTEGGAIAVGYAFIIGWLVYRELSVSFILECLWNTVLSSAKVFYIIATAGLFTWLLTANGFHNMIGNFLLSITKSPTIMLFMIMAILLFITTFMESIATLILLLPILYPVAFQVGIDPIHFGVMVTIAIGVGLVTPPVGLCLYVAADISGLSIIQASKALIPYIIIMFILMIIFVIFPDLITFIPVLLMG